MVKKVLIIATVAAAALFGVGLWQNGKAESKYAQPIVRVGRMVAQDVSTGAKVTLEEGSRMAKSLAERF